VDLQKDGEMQMDRTMSNGIVNELSNHSVDDTVERLKAMLQSSGAVLFGLVDHNGEAEKLGLEMKPTKLLIFGNPKAGTPLMLASPSTAIDLPLKMRVWEDAAKKVWISYNSPEYLQKRHGFPEDLLPNISALRKLASGGAR
jgi:uncharacterized protein (DUF302 family)